MLASWVFIQAEGSEDGGALATTNHATVDFRHARRFPSQEYRQADLSWSPSLVQAQRYMLLAIAIGSCHKHLPDAL